MRPKAVLCLDNWTVTKQSNGMMDSGYVGSSVKNGYPAANACVQGSDSTTP